MSSLLSYELSVAGPLTDTWPLDDVLPVLERGSVPVPSEHHKRHVLPRSVAHPPFKPAWETDSFRLPPVCRTIQTRLQVPLHLATAEMLEVLHEARPVISVVSTRRGAGATTVSLVLAHSLVKAGRNVALVDADLGAVRSLADQLGVAVDGGWNSALALGIDATECTVQSLADGFCIVPLERSDQPGHSSGDGQVPLTALLRRMVGSFDVVVVDCGNDAATLDAAALDLECIRILVKDMRTGDAVTGGRIARAHGRVHIVENFAPVSTH
jgi:Mrp family chromosome partitioning ATPase